jgi:ferredoxin
MEGEGPGTSGKLRNVGLVLSSSDAVALDSILSLIMGLSPGQILTTKEAARRKLGIADSNSIETLGENLKDFDLKPFDLPSVPITQRLPEPLINIAKNFIKFYPRIDRKACNLCQACLKACPKQAITIKFESINIDYSKCVSCFCCQESCPQAAIEIKRSALAKMIELWGHL